MRPVLKTETIFYAHIQRLVKIYFTSPDISGAIGMTGHKEE